ncbi:MAG: DUF3098 domain-containing protein [Bacteroidales bacterium]|jgi:multisubunit Na+/H+ antiporter MnhB subunit|nr:DUF3098 domain-containing protein [Bacteroidales bacterium]
MAEKKKEDKAAQMAVTRKGLILMVVGLVVTVIGFIVLSGGGSKDPNVFNEAMFDFRRLVAAPVLILAGLIVEVVGIMGWFRKKGE